LSSRSGNDALILAIDLGTTHLKVALFSTAGKLVAQAIQEVPPIHPEPLRAELDPRAWWQALEHLVPRVLTDAKVGPQQVDAIGLCGLMHALVLTDATGEPLTRSMLWMDQRCKAECEWLASHHGERIEELTGGLPRTTTSAAKLFWLKRHRPELIDATHRLLLPKDFLRLKLTGTWATDPTDAGGTAMVHPRGECRWAQEYIRDILEVPLEKFPPIQAQTQVAGETTPEAARFLGLRPGIPVVTGSSDVYSTMLGINLFVPERLGLYMGTAAWIASDFATADPQAPTLACTATFGATAHWFLKQFHREGSVSELFPKVEAEAAEAAPGADGVLFLPHLMGERGPYRKADAKGVFFGLTLSHGRGHLFRSILEGTACQTRHIIEALELGGVKELWCVGGCSRSPLWMRILATVTGLPVVTPRTQEAGLLGAAALAAVGTGHFPDLETVTAAWVHPGRRYEPETEPIYEDVYRRYRDLDAALQPFFGS